MVCLHQISSLPHCCGGLRVSGGSRRYTGRIHGSSEQCGVWNIKRQCWVEQLSHPSTMTYDWIAYPPLRHEVRAEVVFMAKGDDQLPCETVGNAVSRHYVGLAAEPPLPLGFEALGGRATNVLHPYSSPSPYSGLGILRVLPGLRTIVDAGHDCEMPQWCLLWL